MRVVHVSEKVEGALFIGRPSKWGNPYHIGKDGTREEVIEKYRKYLMTNPELFYSLPEIRGYEALACYCAPQPCHGDVIIRVFNEYFDGTDMVPLIIAITGSRKGVPPERVREAMEPWMRNNNHFILGGAAGVDNEALKYCQEKGQGYVVCVPHRWQDQPRECHPYLEKAVDEQVMYECEFDDYPKPTSYHRRNLYMLTKAGEGIFCGNMGIADIVLAFPNDSGRAAMLDLIKSGKIKDIKEPVIGRGGTVNCATAAYIRHIPVKMI